MPSPLPTFREMKPSDPVWQTLTIDRTLAQLETDARTGLTESQAVDSPKERLRQRQQQFGANALVAAAIGQWWQILLDQFTNIMLVMLLVVAVVSGIFDYGKVMG